MASDRNDRDKRPRLRTLLAALATTAVAGCALLDHFDQDQDPDAGAPGDAGPGQCVAVDRFKELVIVEPSVVNDPVRAAPGGAWSFKHLIEQMKPDAMNAADFVRTWLEDFKVTEVNGFPVSVRAGIDAMLAAWPKTTDGRLDLDRAPFRLIAVTNRLDLRHQSPPGAAGEGRLVFAGLANGAPASFTVIFEYLLLTDGGRDAVFWARTWHALGALPFGESYNQALEAVTRQFTEKNAAPSRINGSALGQVRTNEIQFGSVWELREFRLDGGGALRIAPTVRCPDQSFNGGQALASFVRDHADEVRAGTHVLPPEMLGGACQESPAHVWRLPGVDEGLRKAFALETCNGCHSAETASKDGFYHVAPNGTGVGRLSRFLHDPSRPGSDELSARAEKLSSLLCEP